MKLDPVRLKIAAVVMVAALGYQYFAGDGPAPAVAPAAAPPAMAAAPAAPGELRGYNQAKVRVTMYSLTTCGFCKAMGRELTARNIPYVERFIDADPGARDELTSKLARAGFRPGAIGTPTLEVNGVMLPNNPSIRTVLKQLQG